LKGPEKIDYHPVSTTLKRQREIFVARIIQRTWRNHVRIRVAAREAAATAGDADDRPEVVVETNDDEENAELEIPFIVEFETTVAADVKTDVKNSKKK